MRVDEKSVLFHAVSFSRVEIENMFLAEARKAVGNACDFSVINHHEVKGDLLNGVTVWLPKQKNEVG